MPISLRSRLLPFAALAMAFAASAAPPTGTVPADGITERPNRHIALSNARIVTEPGRVIERGTIVLREGRIVSVAAGDAVPTGAAVRDMQGRTVFAAFVDVAADVGVPASMRRGAFKPAGEGQPAHDQQAGAAGSGHWNRRVRPELSVARLLEVSADEARAMRELGFAAAVAAPSAGIFAGQGALLSLREDTRANPLVLAADISQHIGFDFAYGSEYPGSLMGAIALIRQTLLDARWHGAQPREARIDANMALDALQPLAAGRQRVLFQLDDELDLARAAKLVREFGLDAMLLGSGHEYRVLADARAARLPLVLPLAFPEVPEVERGAVAASISLAELLHWEQAPANPARVAAAGLRFALTRRGLDDASKFWPRLRRAVDAGLAPDEALRALTVTPAELLGESDRLGRIAPGRLANLLVADADLFTRDDAKRYELWVEGERVELTPIAPAFAGQWELAWADRSGPTRIELSGEGESLDAVFGAHTLKARRDGALLRLLPPAAAFDAGGGDGVARIELRLEHGELRGFRQLADGRRIGVSGRRIGDASAKADAKEATAPPAISPHRGYPAGEYARDGLPPRPAVLLVRGATVWTNDEAGRLERADVLVRDGRISAVGPSLTAPAGATIIEADGRHLTPGIIDAHSHAAIARNVNEPSHAVTTEVRIVDVIDPTDINLYRQLAGGVTTANLLHGSANPMGGQNAVIKLRWGAGADGLLFDGAPAGVKFALGENVKQSNWGDGFRSRYPQTRMGVEQLMRERFNEARAYAAAQEAARRTRGTPPRRDLRLEALAEILDGRRLIHIHSYRQDEILMFVRLAEEYGLPVGTFQHVLEGYKVADAIRDLGAGASTFSDWWAFKMEVMDGTPYNATLMTRVGVVSSFNSDSNELARRLNTEAAKAIKYGGLDEIEALKLVTLNPARQLRIDHRVGRIAAGMDADFVLWNGHPLSTMSRVEQTWIDGRRYFDLEEDRRLQQAMLDERERLLARAGAERANSLNIAANGKTETPADPEAVRHILQHRHWLFEHASERGLYHDGADMVGCMSHEHGH